MTASNTIKPTKKNEILLLPLSSILITLFFCFIDEGYYNFNWMTDIGNWITFFIYAILIFLFQLLLYKVVLKKYQGKYKAVLSIVLGITLGFLFAIGIIFI
ncbi:MAG: hypothetical protein COB15_00560 [Flavobacteriales bacterium]|nr:MAG: hypothetical protein COB15_00560 [Flavobacteriales bacterium]